MLNTRLIKDWIADHEPQGATKLAAGAEVSLATVNKIVNQEHSPNIETVRAIAKAMGVSLDELCRTDDGPEAA